MRWIFTTNPALHDDKHDQFGSTQTLLGVCPGSRWVAKPVTSAETAADCSSVTPSKLSIASADVSIVSSSRGSNETPVDSDMARG